MVSFAFMLPCIVKDFFNNWSSILTLLGRGQHKPARNLTVPNVQQRTPDDGQRRCQKHVGFYDRINLVNQCVWLVFKKEIWSASIEMTNPLTWLKEIISFDRENYSKHIDTVSGTTDILFNIVVDLQHTVTTVPK